MSTRYVWEKYNREVEGYTHDTRTDTAFVYYYYTSDKDFVSGSPAAQSTNILHCGSHGVEGEAYFWADGAYWDISYKDGTYTQDKDVLILKNTLSVYQSGVIYSKTVLWRKDKTAIWTIKSSSGKITITLENSEGSGHTFDIQSNPTAIVSRGQYLSDISDGSFSKYPQDGTSGYYYYVYKGSDNIDPTSLSYSKQGIKPGDSVTVTAAPRTPVYGGTVYYQFSYSLNGGSTWTNIGSKTTSPNASITIPTTADQFCARVIASDDLGFTSTNYVSGQNLILNEAPTPPAYVSIPETIYTGNNFYISWGASTDPDGNLSGYEVQRAYDGGTSWISLTTGISATSILDTVEEGHISVQYRVRAKDTHGYVSEWVYSPAAMITKLKAYVGVGGKARAVKKIYVGVNGKAREVVHAYVGAGGKARKIF